MNETGRECLCLSCPMATPALKVAQAVLSYGNEVTSYPWWFICDAPKSFVKPEDIPRHIIGPFMSRKEAENEMCLHSYGDNAFVFCASGRDANTFRTAVDSAACLLKESQEFVMDMEV